jgi:hypothetical protein
MPPSAEDLESAFDEEYEDYVEFQCPLCSASVGPDDETCPGCGAIFVESTEEAEAEDPGDLEVSEDYELDADTSFDDMDDDALDAEIAAMEAEMEGDVPYDDELMLDDGEDLFDLDLAYEDDLEVEEEVEAAFGVTAIEVSGDDHLALEEMSKPTMMERMFHRAGLGMFIAGGAATVLIILWDSINGQALNLGATQWRFLVLALAMFIVGFIVELAQAYSLASDEDLLKGIEVEV